MAVTKELYPEYPPGLRKALGLDQEKPPFQVLTNQINPTNTPVTVSVAYWCRVCQQKKPASEFKSCDCGIIMCKRCWHEWANICPICETNLQGITRKS